MNTLDEFVGLLGKDVSQGSEISEKTLRNVLEFGLTTDRQMTVELTGIHGSPRKVRLLGRDTSQGVLLVRLLGDEVPSHVHVHTATCLAELSGSHDNRVKIRAFPGVFDALVSLLLKARLPNLREQIMRCLSNLALLQDNHMTMASSSVLEALVKFLETDQEPSVHGQTVRCLTNLAVLQNCERIASYPGVLDGLVGLLRTSRTMGVLEETLKCLTKLAELPENQLTIVSDYFFLDALVRFLGENGRAPNLQLLSIVLLNVLVENYQRNKVKVASHTLVLNALVGFLKCDTATTARRTMQLKVATCLNKLTSVDQNLVKIASHPLALDNLFSCLRMRTVRTVQTIAAESLDNLLGVEENQEKIVSHPGAIAAFLRMLVKSKNPDGQELVVSCLGKLAIKLTIASHPDILDALVEVLVSESKNYAPKPLVRAVIGFVSKLALSGENQVRIVSHHDLFGTLVRLLRNNVDLTVLEHTTKCMSLLSEANENKVKMAHASVLAALASLLLGSRSTFVLEQTTKCLTNVASLQENQVKIASFPGILDGLKVLLSPDMSSNVQEQVLRCLNKLSEPRENRLKISLWPGLKDALWSLGRNGENSVQASMCLTRLSLKERLAGSLTDPDFWCVDPILCHIMCDPVICNDGRTYDRWTIIDGNIVCCPYDSSMTTFRIKYDNVDLRRQLFTEHPEQEQEFRHRRHKYREEALQHARRGEFEDAIVKLNNVLMWARSDKECLSELDRIQSLQSTAPHSLDGTLGQLGAPNPNVLLSSPNQGPAPLPGPTEQNPVSVPPLGPLERGRDSAPLNIPVILHEDIIRESRGAQIALIIVLLYLGFWFVIF